MPTGFPNDPAAHAELMRAKNAEALSIDRARVAAGGPLKLKRSHTKKTARVTQKKTGKPAMVIESNVDTKELWEKFNASQQTVKDLESDLKDWQERYDKAVTKIGDLQDVGNDLRMHIFTILDLVANQK